MNFIEGRVGDDGFLNAAITNTVLAVACTGKQFNMLKEKKYLNKPIVLGIRPEDIKDDAADISGIQRCYFDPESRCSGIAWS